MSVPNVFIALLVKQKSAVLSLFLETLEAYDYPKDNIFLYVRTNNNTDNTEEILEAWIQENANKYRGLIYDKSSVAENVERFGVHEWNGERFRVLGRIRQESLRQCLETDSDYYLVVDIDNFLFPETLAELVKLQLPIVAPLLRYAIAVRENADTPEDTDKLGINMGVYYANYHDKVDDYGSILPEDSYYKILDQNVRGLIICDCVHCTYLIKREYIDRLTYLENSDRWEYMVFSASARENNVTQYLDNRTIYGVLTLTENERACRWWMNHLKDPVGREERYRNRD
jgi:hypothetical protein